MDPLAADKRMASMEPGHSQKYELQAGEHIVALRGSRPCVTVGICKWPPDKGVAGGEEGGKWAKIAAGSHARGVEFPSHSDRSEACAVRPPRCRTPQARDLGKEVGVGTAVGRRPNLTISDSNK